MSVWIVAAALALQTQGVRASTAPRWALRADPALCVLERRSTEPAATVSINTTPGIDTYRIAISASTIKNVASHIPASLTFAPSGKTLDGLASVARLPDHAKVIWMDGVAPELLDDLKDASAVTIATKSGENVSAPIVKGANAIEALRRCNADQLIEWGADAAQFAPGGKAPVAVKSRDDWLSDDQLIAVKRRSRASSVDAIFRVAVSQVGSVDDCQAVDDKTEKAVEQAVCGAVMHKTLFEAGKAADGHPVRGVATFRVLLASRTGSSSI